jgi:hypothetical protein
MRTKLLLLLLTGFLLQLTGQDNGNRLHVNISYFGILGTHPGIKVGVQYPLLTINEGKSVEKLDQLLGAANFIFYYHRRNQIGTGFNVELGYRHRKINGLNKEVFLGVGYLRSFLPNATYDFDGENGMVRKRSLGKNQLFKTAAIGLGRNSGENFTSDFWVIKPTLLHLKPFNRGSAINFALDAGFQLH